MTKPFEVAVIDEGYEAFVTVKRRRVTKQANGNGYFDDPATSAERVMIDLKITASSLEGIQLRVKQHVDLMEDE